MLVPFTTNIERTSRERLKFTSFDEVPNNIMPDLRTPDSIQHDLKQNELLIDRMLNVNDDELSPKNAVPVPQSAKDSNDSSSLSDVPLTSTHCNEVSTFESTETKSDAVSQSTETNIEAATQSVKLHCAEEAIETTTESCDYDTTIAECAEYLNSSDMALIHSCCEKYWREFRLPFPIKWICVSQTNVFCGSVKQSVYQTSRKQFQLSWQKQKYRASKMAVSQSGNILWKLDLGILYALKDANDPDSWKLIARNVTSVSVNDWSAWYVSGGLIFAQTGLFRGKTFSESIKMECDCEVSKICCFYNNVWVLTIDGLILSRELVSEENPFGSSWKRIKHAVTIADIALGTCNTGWIIDKFNNIFFSDDFNNEKKETHWWQVIIGRHIYKSDSTLSDQLSRFRLKEKPSLSVIGSSNDSVWVSASNENAICINKTAILGHSWTMIPLYTSLIYKTKWRFLAAVGEDEQNASVWCLSCSNDLFLYLSKRNYMRAVEMPTTNDVVSVTAVPDMMWILTDKSEIFVRRGISNQTQYGWAWEQLHIYQMENSVSLFKHLSIGREVIWALDAHDNVYAAVADVYSITSETFVLDWVLIEDCLLPETKFIDVVVGPNKHMVWALDDKYNVYTRRSIVDSSPFGTEWVKVSGIKAIQLTLSSSAVWALTAEGYVYRRSGVTAKDCVGEYWSQVPGCLSLITASMYENMWGVSKTTGRLLKYENHLLSLKEDFVRNRKFSENIEDEWEIVADPRDIYQLDD